MLRPHCEAEELSACCCRMQVLLHKDVVVSLSPSRAKSDRSLESPRHPLLQPGEEMIAKDMEPTEPTDAGIQLMAGCLNGMNPLDYVWVKVPMGATIKVPAGKEGPPHYPATRRGLPCLDQGTCDPIPPPANPRAACVFRCWQPGRQVSPDPWHNRGPGCAKGQEHRGPADVHSRATLRL